MLISTDKEEEVLDKTQRRENRKGNPPSWPSLFSHLSIFKFFSVCQEPPGHKYSLKYLIAKNPSMVEQTHHLPLNQGLEQPANDRSWWDRWNISQCFLPLPFPESPWRCLQSWSTEPNKRRVQESSARGERSKAHLRNWTATETNGISMSWAFSPGWCSDSE